MSLFHCPQVTWTLNQFKFAVGCLREAIVSHSSIFDLWFSLYTWIQILFAGFICIAILQHNSWFEHKNCNSIQFRNKPKSLDYIDNSTKWLWNFRKLNYTLNTNLKNKNMYLSLYFNMQYPYSMTQIHYYDFNIPFSRLKLNIQ